MDSMDMLDIWELRKRFKIQIPEEDYPNLVSMQRLDYLEPLLPRNDSGKQEPLSMGEENTYDTVIIGCRPGRWNQAGAIR